MTVFAYSLIKKNYVALHTTAHSQGSVEVVLHCMTLYMLIEQE